MIFKKINAFFNPAYFQGWGKQKNYFRQYYLDHKDEYIERNNKTIEANRAERIRYLRNYYIKNK